MSVKYVLFVTTNTAVIGPKNRKTGFFFPEIAHPFQALDRAGMAVEFATPLGGKPPEDGFDGDDVTQTDFLKSKAYRRLSRSRRLDEVDVLDYHAVFFPGGLGPLIDISGNPVVQHVVSTAWNAGMIVAAVCHGPSAFLGVKTPDGTPLVSGRRLTSFSKAEEDGYALEDVPFDLETALRAEGARYEATEPWHPKVMVDGRLITGQNPQSGAVVGDALVEPAARPPAVGVLVEYSSAGAVMGDGDTVIVIATWQTTAAALADVLAMAGQLRQRSLAEDGCLGYELHQRVGEPTTLLLIERYRDAAAHSEHVSSAHFRDLVLDRIVPLLTHRNVEMLRPRG